MGGAFMQSKSRATRMGRASMQINTVARSPGGRKGNLVNALTLRWTSNLTYMGQGSVKISTEDLYAKRHGHEQSAANILL